MSDDEIRTLLDEAEEFDPDDDQPSPQQNSGPQPLAIGSDVEIAQRVADDLYARHGEVVFSEGDFWFYDETHWRRIEDHDLRRTVHNYDGILFPTGNSMSVLRLNKARIDSIIHELSVKLASPKFFADPPTGINCASDFIRFAEDGTPSYEPHNRDHRSRHVLKGRWSPHRLFFEWGYEGSLLQRLLEGIFRDDPDMAEKIILLQEIAGAAALGYGTRLQQPKAVILAGATAENGKSQVLDLLRGLLPSEAIASIPAAKMSDERFTPCLIGKHLNAADELSGAAAIASDTFKAIVTGEPVTGREVYRTSVTFRPVALHVFCTNTLPSFVGGMDRGIQRRLLPILFNRVIPKEERVERIGQRIGEEKANILLFWAVEGASRLIRQRRFTVPPSSETALRDWLRASDPVLAWIETNVTAVDPQSTEWEGAKAKSADAYRHFRDFAVREGYRENTLPAINSFVLRLLANRSTINRKHTNTGNWLVGIRLPTVDRDAFFGASGASRPSIPQ